MARNAPLLAGWARTEITPAIPCDMGGYAARPGPANATHDPLYAYALALGTQAQRLVILICDLIGVDEAMVREVRQRLAQPFPGTNIWPGVTHTHAGPEVVQAPSFTQQQSISTTRERIIAGACEAASAALTAMHPVRVKRAGGAIHGVATNRDYPEQYRDLTLDMLCFYDTNKPPARPAAVFASFPCHPTVLSAANLAFSADLPGAWRRQLHALLGTDTWLCLATGAAGNISTRHTRQGQSFEELERLGTLLAQQAYALLATARPLKLGLPQVYEQGIVLDLKASPAPAELAAFRQSVQARTSIAQQAGNLAQARTLETILQGIQAALQRPLGNHERQREITVSVAFLGACTLVAVPGELYHELGTRIQRASERFVLLSGYTNGYVGYLPTSAAYAEMDYEALMSPFAPQAGEQLADHLASVLQQKESKSGLLS